MELLGRLEEPPQSCHQEASACPSGKFGRQDYVTSTNRFNRQRIQHVHLELRYPAEGSTSGSGEEGDSGVDRVLM